MVSNKNVCRSAEDMTFTYYSQKPFQYVFVDWHYLSDQRINRWLYLSSSLQRNSLGNSPSPRFVKENNRSERVPFIATRIHQLLDVCKIFLCSELCPNILENCCRNRRKWKFQGVMLYKQTQKIQKALQDVLQYVRQRPCIEKKKQISLAIKIRLFFVVSMIPT